MLLCSVLTPPHGPPPCSRRSSWPQRGLEAGDTPWPSAYLASHSTRPFLLYIAICSSTPQPSGILNAFERRIEACLVKKHKQNSCHALFKNSRRTLSLRPAAMFQVPAISAGEKHETMLPRAAASRCGPEKLHEALAANLTEI